MFANNFYLKNQKFTASDNYEFHNSHIAPHLLTEWRKSSVDEQLTILNAASKTIEVAK